MSGLQEWTPDEPDSDELVDLGEGQFVPRRFQLPIHPGSGIPAHLVVTVIMVGTRPTAGPVRITPQGVDGIDVDDLARIDWRAVLRTLVQIKAIQLGGWLAFDDLGATMRQFRERRDKAGRAARSSLRRNAVTPEDLAEIVRLVDAEGVSATVEKTGKSRSYIYKLLARAREEQP